jgi:hypothetical protein
MWKDPRIWTGGLLLVVAGWLLVPQLAPRRPPAIAAELVPEIRYVCSETGEVFLRRATAAALPHPTTGRPTLVPAAFDRKKQRWIPGPPPEVMHRRGQLRPAS